VANPHSVLQPFVMSSSRRSLYLNLSILTAILPKAYHLPYIVTGLENLHVRHIT
jgi:hypothetical protein